MATTKHVLVWFKCSSCISSTTRISMHCKHRRSKLTLRPQQCHRKPHPRRLSKNYFHKRPARSFLVTTQRAEFCQTIKLQPIAKISPVAHTTIDHVTYKNSVLVRHRSHVRLYLELLVWSKFTLGCKRRCKCSPIRFVRKRETLPQKIISWKYPASASKK